MKKIIALILALLMMMTLFVGCSGDDIITDAEEVYYNLQLEAFYDDNGERHFTVDETFEEEPMTVEYNNIACITYTSGNTVKEVLEENYMINLQIIDENGTFMGWLKHEYESEIDEFGNDMGTYKKVDDTLYTTEEMLNMEIVDKSLCFVAKWSDIEDSYYAENGY
ncbi:MAG: hypothetical protein IJO20_03305 [Ruminococcus sp.]|nr:hypothetical protein [Ruminococcus sp.]